MSKHYKLDQSRPKKKTPIWIQTTLGLAIIAAITVVGLLIAVYSNIPMPQSLSQSVQLGALQQGLTNVLPPFSMGGDDPETAAQTLRVVSSQEPEATKQTAVSDPAADADTGAVPTPNQSPGDASGQDGVSSLLFNHDGAGTLGIDNGGGNLIGGTAQLAGQSSPIATVYTEADAAFTGGDWEAAVELYEEVRDLDGEYQRVIVQKNLTVAYRNLAQQTLAAAPDSPTEAEAARRALNSALGVSPDDPIAAEELKLLTGYVTGVRLLELESPAEAVAALQNIVADKPAYLDGLAARKLYEAYLSLGDIAVRQGNLATARDFYDEAVAVALPDQGAVEERLRKLDNLLYLTPTPYPRNLATVQAFAQARRLPPVLLETPLPADGAEATGRAEFATAMALTTGTFTPVPENYVTPMLVMGVPPAENVATDAARAAEATARVKSALVPTSTPPPYNAVMAEYVFATPLPGNAATAEAQAVIDEANAILYGTPTPPLWNEVIITRVPTPLPPTSTPLPLLMPVTDLTPTPTITPTVSAPETLPQELRSKIIFLSDRGGSSQTYAMDPTTGEVNLVTAGWVHPLAQRQLTLAPDGKHEAMVLADSSRVLQIQVHSKEYGTTRQVTAVRANNNPNAIAYDPAWSPAGNLIAYASSETQGDELYTVNLDSGQVVRLTNNTWEWDKHPTWSPDGSQILFYSNRDTGRRQLWIMNADGSNPRNFSNNEFNDWDPIWIP